MVLLPRLALAIRRAPQYDELFTVWIARKAFAPMMETLRLDSGPPLYYLLIRALGLLEVPPARGFSVAVAVLGAIVCCRAVEKATDRLIVGALLAVYPLHLYFATEARAYAVCALLVGVAATTMDRWVDSASRNALAVAAVALVAGAYAHHYVVFLFPMLIAFAVLFRRDRLRDAIVATVAMAIAFVPGALLLRAQIPNAVPWMRIDDDAQRILLTLGAAARIGFDGRQPVPYLVQLLAMIALGAAVIATFRAPRARRYLVVIALAIGGAVVAAAIGLPAYFPLRFESILAIPVVLWLFFAAMSVPRAAVPLIGCALLVGVIASASLLTRAYPPSPLQIITSEVLKNVPRRQPIVASGAAYLALSLEREVVPLPAAHAIQPGRELPVTAEAARLTPPFIFVGSDRGAAFGELARTRQVRVLGRAGDVVAVRVD